MIRSMLRTSRAIRTWLLMKHDTAALLGEPRIELERALAKHLLDCSLLFLLRCRHTIILLQPSKLTPVAGQRAAELPRIPGLEQILEETIVFLQETALAPSRAQHDASSQLGSIFNPQTPFQATSSQQTASSQQPKLPSDGSKATKALIPADGSLEAPTSHLELAESLIDRSEGGLQELASYSGQAVALKQVKIAVELPQLLQVPPYKKNLRKVNGILLHGPPGTGKTAIARLLASRAGITTFKVSPSCIMSRYDGDGEK